ncbi:superoxide dismutase [Xylariaceae sp. FL0016]|nr:superoxide dismutase [Xylariaceae sp. FL0016]
MRLSNIVSFSAIGATSVLAQTGAQGDAIAVTDNPVGKTAVATLPSEPFFTGGLDGNVVGSVKATSGPNGRGVDFQVTFSNLPKTNESFTYHLHDAPVPEDGNCTSTLAHLDPFIRGEDPACDSAKPATCQVGDLSGKHGKITSDPFTATYHDDFASLKDGIGAYFGNRSFVVHFANKTRISCANFQIGSNSTYTTTPTGGASSTPTETTTSTSVPVTGAADSALNLAKNFAVVPLFAMLLTL